MNRFILFLSIALTVQTTAMLAADQGRVPVLVELFTSEGCSSCPPADRLLEKFDQQPIPGAELVVLSEHVDYWNHDGWKDPFSSALMSERQRAYAERLHLDTVYTPQMIVDGSSEFSGANATAAQKAIGTAISQRKLPVRLSPIASHGDRVSARIETGTLDDSYGAKSADLYVAVALNRAESQVLRGENANRHLTHVAVVQRISKIARIKPGEQFAREVELKLDRGSEPANLRMLAFLQDPATGKVLGAAMTAATASTR